MNLHKIAVYFENLQAGILLNKHHGAATCGSRQVGAKQSDASLSSILRKRPEIDRISLGQIMNEDVALAIRVLNPPPT
jgi:hypothetical protein